MSESRCGESRGFSYPTYRSESRGYTPYSSWSSESRESSESRVIPVLRTIGLSASSESREASESCAPIRRVNHTVTGATPTKREDPKSLTSEIPAQYNNFEDIDTLIEQLEVTLPILEQLQSRGEKYSKSLKRRQQQIEKLKQLREDRIISEIERESDSFDEQIESVKKLTLTPKKKVEDYHPSWGYEASESHDGESRW